MSGVAVAATPKVRVKLVENIFRPEVVEVRHVDAGIFLKDCVPEKWNRDFTSVLHNGEEASPHSLQVVGPRDDIEIYRRPGDPTTLIVGILISAALSGITYAISAATAPSVNDDTRRFRDSTTYGFDGIVNTAQPGERIPIVYGEHRIGGLVLGSFQTDPVNGPFLDVENATSVLNTLLAVGSGGVAGIESLSSVRIDRNPIENFRSTILDVRLGDLVQEVIPGFEEVRNQILKGDQLTQVGGSLTYTTIDEIDRFGVVLSFPGGIIRIDDAGNERGFSVRFLVEYSLAGANEWRIVPVEIVQAKTRSPLKVFIEQPTPIERAKYDIRITRLTEDDPNVRKSSKSEVFAITEILSDGLTYPLISLYSVRQLPTNQFSGRAPQYDALVKGRLVRVFSDTETFKFQWSDNPAWCTVDFFLDENDGLGAFVSQDRLIMEDFLEWAQFCDELVDVDDGRSQERQFRLDYVVDGTQRAIDVLQQMYSTGRAFRRIVGNKWGVVIDRDEPATQFFSMGRIHKGQFQVLKKTTQDKPNIFHGTFFNRDEDYERDSIPIQDPNLVPGDELIEATINLAGSTRPTQVARLLNYHMLAAKLRNKEVELEVGVSAINAKAGQIALVTHDAPKWGFSGKILGVENGGGIITIDRDVTIESGKQYELAVAHVEDEGNTVDFGVVGNGPGTTNRIVVTQGLTKEPTVGTDYSFGEIGKTAEKFRIIAIERAQEPHRRKVKLEKHDPAVYAGDISAVAAPTISALPDPRRIPPDATELRVFEHQLLEPDGTLTNQINVHFLMPAVAGASARVYLREIDPTDGPQLWELSGQTVVGFFPIQNVGPAGLQFEVSVVTCSPHGLCKHPEDGARATITTTGVTRQPGDVTGFGVDATFEGLVFNWTPLDPATNQDLDHYEIRQGKEWNTGLLVGRTAGTETELRTSSFFRSVDSDNVEFWIKAVNTVGNYSAGADTVVILLEGRINENVIFTQTEDTTFPGTKTNCFVDTGKLVFDTASGTYETAKFEVSTGNAVRALVQIVLDALQVNKTLTWDSPEIAGETWDGSFAQSTTWDLQSGLDESVRVKIEIRISTLTSADGDFGPWKVRSQGFEASVKWAQARLTVEIDDPNFRVEVSKLRFLFDVPDILDTGRETTSAVGTISVTYNRAFNSEPNVVATVFNPTAGDEIFITNKDSSGFDLAVKNASSFVSRTVEWEAIGF